MLCIPIFGMLSVSRETAPFWYEIHTFVLTVYVYIMRVSCINYIVHLTLCRLNGQSLMIITLSTRTGECYKALIASVLCYLKQ